MSMLHAGAVAVLPWLATAVCSAVDGELLWDNGITAARNAHAISPPAFPNIRQADDFVIEDEAWLVTDVAFQVLEDGGFTRGNVLETYIYADSGSGVPGPLTRLLPTGFEQEFTGRQLFGRDEYHYWIDDLALALGTGLHWLGPRNPEGGGAGTNYWVECEIGPFPCGVDAEGTYASAASLDGGQNWQPNHPDTYHFQFQLFGFRALDALPFVFDVTRGGLVGGKLESLAEDDGEVLRIAAQRPSKVSQPSVEIEIEGFSPVDFQAATAIGFTLDARATAPAIERIELYDFKQARYVRLHEAPASIDSDRTTDVVIRENVSNFITPAASRMRARISYYDPGIPIAAWFGEIDQTIWRVGRPTP